MYCLVASHCESGGRLTLNEDKTRYPKYQTGQVCANCQLYQGKPGSANGPCPIYDGKLVNAKGWCSAYLKKT
ncbi:high-potential iron-sulfur protein [Paraburkholderia domus]|uniref:high-potential iron-sulfur protein n=1 Tax=Paraburkholderia domus TaxID=2793075 RepID=UPI001911668E|nr:high-potential iron-sulfur protein [Burkholderia sp. R-70006]MBK5185180.1 high-potential iron-sulfur protein [Burkholderia sp. R-69749]MCI0151501.1 high-potential iron-sulfur protein [Paraburkholderia sediminicola]